MNESKCKACDAELVYVGSLVKGGVLKCPHCDLSNGNTSVHLNYKEFEIIKILLLNAQTVTKKDDLIV